MSLLILMTAGSPNVCFAGDSILTGPSNDLPWGCTALGSVCIPVASAFQTIVQMGIGPPYQKLTSLKTLSPVTGHMLGCWVVGIFTCQFQGDTVPA